MPQGAELFSGCLNCLMQPENQIANQRQRLPQSANLLSGCPNRYPNQQPENQITNSYQHLP
nr:hypothetical protein [uncultured Kingella sp.]